MKSFLKTIGVLGALALLTGPVASPAAASSGPKVSVAASNASAQRGKTVWVSVKLTIPHPYHANSNPASQSFLIPTSVSLSPGRGIRAGNARYPKGVTKKFSFSDKPISVYEGTVVIKVPVTVAASTKPGVYKLNGTCRYQACDDKNCFIPVSRKFNVTLRVK